MNKDYSQTALGEFFDYAARTSRLPKNTAQARKTASLKLLSVLDGDEAADLRKLDMDDVATRFANRHKADYTGQSLRVYESRARSAINDFIAWVDNPSSFQFGGRSAAKRTNGDGAEANGAKARARTRKSHPVAKAAQPEVSSPNPPPDKFRIPIPLRDGYMVEVVGLPKDLRPHEAQKISAIVVAYATKEQK